MEENEKLENEAGQRLVNYEKNVQDLKKELRKKRHLLDNTGDLDNTSKADLVHNKQEHSKQFRELKKLQRNQTAYTKQINTKRRKISQGEGNWNRSQSEKLREESNLEKLEEELKNCPANGDRINTLQRRQDQINDELYRLEDRKRNLSQSASAFQYNLPRDFRGDRNQVYGKVGNSIQLKDTQFATAVASVAGGGLHSIMVENKAIGSQLLNCSKSRINLLPLRDLNSGRNCQRQLRQAQDRVGEDNVWLAKDLIDYDPRFEVAMNMIFGSVLITRTLSQARELAMGSGIGLVCVSLEGDRADPRGLMEGGFRQKTKSPLIDIAELRNVENEKRSKQSELRQD